MNILVTGASGFLGEAIAKVLSLQNHRLTLQVRKPASVVIRNSTVIEADLLDAEAISTALRGKRFDIVIDSAAAIPRSGMTHGDYFDNIAMTRNLLVALKETTPGYFIKLSTVDVYQIVPPITEQSEIAPENYYALSKRISEQFVELWCRAQGVTSCILRLTQVFGPGDRSGKFIPMVLKQVREGLPVRLFGDGSDMRDYLYVKDAAALICIICEKKIAGILNLATGTSRSLNDVLASLQKVSSDNFSIESHERKKPRIDYIFDTEKLSEVAEDFAFTDFAVALREAYEDVKAQSGQKEEVRDLLIFPLDQIAGIYCEEKGFERTLMKYKIAAITPLCIGETMLDIGCGVGMLTRALAPAFRKVVGIDGSALKIQKAKEHNSAPNIAYLYELFEAYTPDEPFDFIVSTNVLEHVGNVEFFLTRIQTWLRPNGRVVMTVPNAKGFHKRIGKAMGLIDDMFALTEADYKKGHRRVYDKISLVADFEKAGLRVESIGGILLKPLSHSQMEEWDSRIVDALYEIGKELPDYCSSLIITATRSQ